MRQYTVSAVEYTYVRGFVVVVLGDNVASSEAKDLDTGTFVGFAVVCVVRVPESFDDKNTAVVDVGVGDV